MIPSERAGVMVFLGILRLDIVIGLRLRTLILFVAQIVVVPCLECGLCVCVVLVVASAVVVKSLGALFFATDSRHKYVCVLTRSRVRSSGR